jgi:AcrR family transcriptional regulator
VTQPTRDRENPRTRRGRATRAALISAARERFLIDGYLNTGVPSIAATARRSSASFYTYFESKAELLEILARQAIIDLQRRLQVDLDVASTADLPERIARTIWVTFRDELSVLISIFQTAMRDLELEPWHTLRRTIVDAIAEANERLAVDGANLPGPPDVVAAAIASMFEMFCFVWLGQGGDAPGTEVTEEVAVGSLSGVWRASIAAPTSAAGAVKAPPPQGAP